MSVHTGHYLKPARKSYAPGMVFSVTCETDDINGNGNERNRERILHRIYTCHSHKSRGRWSRPIILQFTAGNELRAYLRDVSDKHRRNYVICPIASDVLWLTGFFDYAETVGIAAFDRKSRAAIGQNSIDNSGIIDVRRLILRGRPDILDYTHLGKRYVWLSVAQYTDATPLQIAESIGFDWEPKKDDRGVSIPLADDAENLCLLYSMYYCSLASWWSDVATAPWGYTVGQLSMGVLRSHIKPKTLCSHENSEVHKLERHACYGGRASTWFLGDIGVRSPCTDYRPSKMGSYAASLRTGPIEHVDVRSMYPSLLRDNAFPVSLKSAYANISVKDLREAVSEWGVIATVDIYSDSGEYPRRIGENVEYPRGYFTTVLAGPELASIRGKDKIIRVHNCSIYNMGRSFQEAAGTLLDMRMKARASGNFAHEMFCKSLANSLAGKLAQRKGEWTDRNDIVAERQWGEWFESDFDKGTHKRFRAIAGMVSQYTPDATGSGPYTFAFAYLTSYGRVLMRRVRETFPADTVISQDTDGLWVFSDPLHREKKHHCSYGELPGQLRVTLASTTGKFYGPRHYRVDSGWILSGFHNPKIDPATLRIDDTFVHNPLQRGTRDNHSRLLTEHRTSKLRIDNSHGTVDAFGWWHPRFLDSASDDA